MAYCTASLAPPLLDLGFGGFLTAGMGFIALANLPEGGESTQIGLAWAAGALVAAGLYGYSALHGFVESDRCDAYRAEMLYLGGGAREAHAPLRPPPAPLGSAGD